MAWPDTRECVWQILQDQQFAGHDVNLCYRTPDEYLETAKAGTLTVLIYPLGGTEGAVDRVDRVGVDVTGIGTTTKDVADAIHDVLIPSPYYPARHYTEAGPVDDVQSEATPVDVPFADPTITQFQAVYRVTVRQS